MTLILQRIERINMKGKFKPFTKGQLSDVLRNCLANLKDKVYSEKVEYILNANEEEYVNYLISEFEIDPPEIDFENKYATSEEKMIEASRHPNNFWVNDGESYRRMVLTYHLPFCGDVQVLDFIPNPAILWTSTFEHVETKEGEELLFEVINFSNDADQIKREADSLIGSLSTQLGHIKNQLNEHNNSLHAVVEQLVRDRKKDLLTKSDFLTTLGVPIKKVGIVSETFTVPAPKIPKKIVPRPSVNGTGKPDPTLDNATYDEILKVLCDVGKAIERMPSTYEGKDEESLRDHFLMFLEPQFKGSVTGETFNKNGKTDILLRYEGSNIFVAECKFWGGEIKFLETIDQILSYLTWRDSKSSIMVFVKNLDFTQVVNTVNKAITKHSNFLSIENSQEEGTVLRCKFHLNGDEERIIWLTILLFHFPPRK